MIHLSKAFRMLMLISLIWSGLTYAGNRPSDAIMGTWYSENEKLTFNSGGTVWFEGSKYYYAVSNGGVIQLKGKRGLKVIQFQLAGDKLTLIIDGKSTVYSRKK